MEDLAAEGAIDEKGSLILRKERVFNSCLENFASLFLGMTLLIVLFEVVDGNPHTWPPHLSLYV